MVDDDFRAIWIFTPKDFADLDQFSLLWDIKNDNLLHEKCEFQTKMLLI